MRIAPLFLLSLAACGTVPCQADDDALGVSTCYVDDCSDDFETPLDAESCEAAGYTMKAGDCPAFAAIEGVTSDTLIRPDDCPAS